jgi:DNA-binding NarL/FixJ family response regulator
VISGDSSLESIMEALTKGANGYLLKPFSLKEFYQQIEIVMTGGAVLSPNIAEKIIKSINNKVSVTTDYKSSFTPRQKEVLEYLLIGLSYKEISNLLFLSVTTVNDHIKKIYLKMGVNSKSELANKIFNQRLNQGPLNDTIIEQ